MFVGVQMARGGPPRKCWADGGNPGFPSSVRPTVRSGANKCILNAQSNSNESNKVSCRTAARPDHPHRSTCKILGKPCILHVLPACIHSCNRSLWVQARRTYRRDGLFIIDILSSVWPIRPDRPGRAQYKKYRKTLVGSVGPQVAR